MGDESEFPFGTSQQLLLGVGGMSILSKFMDKANGFLQSTFGLEINILVSVFLIGTMIYASAQHLYGTIKQLLEDYYSCSIRIPSEDQLFGALLEYLENEKTFATKEELSDHVEKKRLKAAKQMTNNKAKKLARADTAASEAKPAEESSIYGINSNERFAWYARPSHNYDANIDNFDYNYWDSDSDSSGSESDYESTEPKKSKKKVKYSPTPGHKHYIYHKPTRTTISIMRVESQQQNTWYYRKPRETAYLSVYGRDLTPIKALLEEVVVRSNLKDVGRTAIFRAANNNGPYWDRCYSRSIRSIDSVILDEAQKEEILADIEEYLMPATAKWYANRGLPYRRGYLLYGPPGTGKTSLTIAIAGKFNLKIYSLSLSSTWMSDDNLATLFSTLPKSCIVLLEDVDACDVTGSRDAKNALPPPEQTNNPTAGAQPLPQSPGSNKSSVTFSGLLNAIDGVASKEGRVLIMTTNHRERLDEALIRPGRVDLQIKFCHSNKQGAYDLFRKLYHISESDRVLLRFPSDFPDDKVLEELARQFTEAVPDDVFTPAELQGFLLRHKKDPRRAVEEAPKWIEETKKEKVIKAEKERLDWEKARRKSDADKRDDDDADAVEKKKKEEEDRQEKKQQNDQLSSTSSSGKDDRGLNSIDKKPPIANVIVIPPTPPPESTAPMQLDMATSTAESV